MQLQPGETSSAEDKEIMSLVPTSQVLTESPLQKAMYT